MGTKYYFFVGQRNASTGEILRILKSQKANFMDVPINDYKNHDISSHELMKIRELGFTPIYIGIHNTTNEPNSYGYPYFDLKKSPLVMVLNLLHLNANTYQKMLMRYNQGMYFYNRFSVINYLIIDGASRKQIEEVQLFDRQSHEIEQKYEEMAEAALNKASSNPLCSAEPGRQTVKKDLLVVDFDTDFPFGREYYTEYLTITDRAYWLQKYQNLVIFDNNVVFYSGFSDVAEALKSQWHSMRYSGYGNLCLPWQKNEKQKEEIINLLTEMTYQKVKDGIL